ncbi:MAG: tetratricopeptide repeat protein [Pyrinomonadaceae bacterium]
MVSTKRLISHFILPILILSATTSLFAQTASDRENFLIAKSLISQSKYIDALPYLEKVEGAFPDDVDYWTYYGIGLSIKGVTLTDKTERNGYYKRAKKALQRASELGTENPRALDLLSMIDSMMETDNFSDANPEVEAALRKGEEFFGRSEWAEAYKYYEKAHKLDPLNYEAVLFMGDCYYSQQAYKQAIPLFQQAIDINSEKSIGHYFLGDAYLYDGRSQAALEKYIDSFIRDPQAEVSWSNFSKWSDVSDQQITMSTVAPPGGEPTGEIVLAPSRLEESDGTSSWMKYGESVQAWKARNVGKRFDVATEAAGLQAVSDEFKRLMKTGKVKEPDEDLQTLVKIADDGMLVQYVYLFRMRKSFSEDYQFAMRKNEPLVRRFIKKYILGIPLGGGSGIVG